MSDSKPPRRRLIPRRSTPEAQKYVIIGNGDHPPRRTGEHTPAPDSAQYGNFLITGPEATGPQAAQTGEEAMAKEPKDILPTEPPPDARRLNRFGVVAMAVVTLGLAGVFVAWLFGWIP